MNPCIVLRKQPTTLTFDEALHEARSRVNAGLGEHEVYELRAAVVTSGPWDVDVEEKPHLDYEIDWSARVKEKRENA